MAAPKAKSRRKLILGIIAIAIIVIAVTPIALAQAINVPLAVARFNETTGTSSAGGLNVTIQIVTAWEYFFSIRTQGMMRTSDSSPSSTSSNGGTTNMNISGGIGGRTHTIYLSVDQGVRVNGNYRLDVTFTANVVLFGGVVEAQFS